MFIVVKMIDLFLNYLFENKLLYVVRYCCDVDIIDMEGTINRYTINLSHLSYVLKNLIRDRRQQLFEPKILIILKKIDAIDSNGLQFLTKVYEDMVKDKCKCCFVFNESKIASGYHLAQFVNRVQFFETEKSALEYLKS